MYAIEQLGFQKHQVNILVIYNIIAWYAEMGSIRATCSDRYILDNVR